MRHVDHSVWQGYLLGAISLDHQSVIHRSKESEMDQNVSEAEKVKLYLLFFSTLLLRCEWVQPSYVNFWPFLLLPALVVPYKFLRNAVPSQRLS